MTPSSLDEQSLASTLAQVPIPTDVKELLRKISSELSIGLGGVATTPLECFDLAGYLPRLIFWVAVPIVVVLLILLSFIIRIKFGGQSRRFSWGSVLEQSAPLLLRAFFILYPSACAIVSISECLSFCTPIYLD